MCSEAVAILRACAFLGSRLWESFLSAGLRVNSGTLANSWSFTVINCLANSRNPVTSACLKA